MNGFFQSRDGRGGLATMGLAVLALAVALAPGVATACATCLSSGFGDRTYNWPYFGLLAMPFLIAGAIGTVLYRHRGRFEAADPSSEDTLDKETT